MRCDVCDFDYSEHWSASRRAHIIVHHEWEHVTLAGHDRQHINLVHGSRVVHAVAVLIDGEPETAAHLLAA